VPPTITLAFAGDVHFTGKTAPLLNDPATAFGPVAQIFQAADLSVVNLETAITTGGTPQAKTYTFRAPPIAFDAIKAAGLDAVSVANNHALDYGQAAFQDELAAAKAAGVPLLGGGVNATEAYAPRMFTVKGVRIAILGFSQINADWTSWQATDTQAGLAMAGSAAQIQRAADAVRAAKAQADVVVVFMHWGQETNSCPIQAQKDVAKAFADAGATMVVGTHAHVLLGDGWMGNTYIAYGMSNFVWYSDSSISNDTEVVRVTLTGSTITKTELLPAIIDSRTGQPIPVSGAQADRIDKKFVNLRGCTGLSAAPPAPATPAA
jgi:poly-gamma-glutamate synthesis protein (capsule biosynthesis protein)